MNYSREEIYKYSGQFDKTVTVSFKSGTDARNTYGDYITGTFYYTPKERENYETIISDEHYEKTYGFIKFLVTGLHELTEKQVGDLRFEGVKASEIIEILQFSKPIENEFSKSDIRNLLDPLTVKVDLSNRDEDEMMLWLNSQRLNKGYKLIPEEINKHNGIILRKYEDVMPKEDLQNFKNIETGEINPEIKYHYLNSKLHRDLLNTKEKEEFQNILKEDANRKVDILVGEIKKSHEKWKQIGINYKEALAWLIHLSSDFRPERLTHGKFPVWWDYENFLHIYMRHVSETQIGERFEGKTVFQYKLQDIKRIIEIVLRQTEKEILQHFEEKPERDFIRIGAQSVYFNGDYYAFHIDTEGKLRTFYKKL